MAKRNGFLGGPPLEAPDALRSYRSLSTSFLRVSLVVSSYWFTSSSSQTFRFSWSSSRTQLARSFSTEKTRVALFCSDSLAFFSLS